MTGERKITLRGGSARSIARSSAACLAAFILLDLGLASLALGAVAARPRFADLDLLWRVRVIAVVGVPAAAASDGDETLLTARAFTRELSGVGRVRTARVETVAAAMARVPLRGPGDLLLRDPRGEVKLDVERAVALARAARADSLLIPFWEELSPEAESGRIPPRRLHALILLVDRREVVWEDTEPVRRTETPSSGSAALEAEIRAATRALARRFAADMRLAGERG